MKLNNTRNIKHSNKRLHKCLKKSMKIANNPDKRISELCHLSQKYDIPSEIMIGIYIIETTCRPTYYRFAEFILVLFNLIMSLLFKKPIHNYTIGRFQIGIGTILYFNGFSNAYPHSVNICNVNLSQSIIILKSFFWKYNLPIFIFKIKEIFREIQYDNYNELIRKIGYLYNGNIIYGLNLESIIKDSSKV